MRWVPRQARREAGFKTSTTVSDVYLVIHRALAEENEVLIEQVNVIINQPSFGVHRWSPPTANRSRSRRCSGAWIPYRAALGGG